jgi:hypothetical protein
MPVYRYHSFEEAERAMWRKPGDPRNGRITAWIWAFSAALLGPAQHMDFGQRGLKKFRSIEEANADRERWEKERSRFLRLQHTPVRTVEKD